MNSTVKSFLKANIVLILILVVSYQLTDSKEGIKVFLTHLAAGNVGIASAIRFNNKKE